MYNPKKILFFCLSILAYCFPKPSEAGDIFFSNMNDSIKAYSIETDNEFLYIADYQNGSIVIKNSKGILIKQIDSVNIDGARVKLNFVHSALPLEKDEILACVSKKNKNNPKLQGQAIVINLSKNNAHRIDNIFKSDEFVSFPTTCSFVNGYYVVSYAGALNAVIFFSQKGRVEKIIGNKNTIHKNIKDNITSSAQILDLDLSNPHKVINLSGAYIIADTGNNSVVKIVNESISFLAQDGANLYSWSNKKPIVPTFSSPTSIKIYGKYMYIVNSSSGVIKKINLSVSSKFQSEDLYPREKFSHRSIKAFDVVLLNNSLVITSPDDNVIFYQ